MNTLSQTMKDYYKKYYSMSPDQQKFHDQVLEDVAQLFVAESTIPIYTDMASEAFVRVAELIRMIKLSERRKKNES